jgi:putative membrane protein
MRDLQLEVRGGKLELFHLQLLDGTLRDLINTQGGCERIKNTPFPRGYGYIAERLILVFSILLPMGMAEAMSWYAVPISILVCSGFLLISETGRVLEDPFTLFWPALPLAALSRTIEINLLERLGVSELPPALTPNERGVLM